MNELTMLGLEELFRAEPRRGRAAAAAAGRSAPRAHDALRGQPRAAGALPSQQNKRDFMITSISHSYRGRSRLPDPTTDRPLASADSLRPARRRRFRWRSPNAPSPRTRPGREFQIGVLTGASTGPSLDGALAKAKAISFRTPYQTNADLRDRINAGQDALLRHAPLADAAGDALRLPRPGGLWPWWKRPTSPPAAASC